MIVTHSTVLAQPPGDASAVRHSLEVHIDDDRITYKMWQSSFRFSLIC
jgi:hypothetical protein